MDINEFRISLLQFIGTTHYYKLKAFPIYATAGVEYFCRILSAYWLFDDMCEIAITNPNEEFIVVVATVKDDNTCDVVYDNGNGDLICKQHYIYTNLPEGSWKFYISNYPNEKVVMLPSEY
ncbi:MAG: hypothetical protein LUH11_04065 [Candidatus Gastranaerophilales bacterium]|nr:hypothetical protein [Candidatus Gastranaerophilales bacterium]